VPQREGEAGAREARSVRREGRSAAEHEGGALRKSGRPRRSRVSDFKIVRVIIGVKQRVRIQIIKKRVRSSRRTHRLNMIVLIQVKLK
jgi:hypothetical protein